MTDYVLRNILKTRVIDGSVPCTPMFDEARLGAAQELIETEGVKLYDSISPLPPELSRSRSSGRVNFAENDTLVASFTSQASAPGPRLVRFDILTRLGVYHPHYTEHVEDPRNCATRRGTCETGL